MNIKQANRLVLEKWDILRKVDYRKYKKIINNGEWYVFLEKVLPEKMFSLKSYCGWCEINKNKRCVNCLLTKIGENCYLMTSAYFKYIFNLNRKTANKMYKVCQKAIKVWESKKTRS